MEGRVPGCPIALTGAPGAGKSTLVDRPAKAWRAAGSRVGIIVADPASPFTGETLAASDSSLHLALRP